MVFRDALCDCLDVRMCLLQSHARLHPGNNEHVVIVMIGQLLLCKRCRYPDGGRGRSKLKVCGHHAYDRVLLSVEYDLSAKDAALASITLLPQTMTEDRDCCAAGLVFVSSEVPSNHREYAEQRKGVGRYAI